MQTVPAPPDDPLIVITDSTELYNSYLLNDTRWTTLASEIQAGKIRWIVPEVVVQETIRHQREAWESAHKETIPVIKKAEKSLRALGMSLTIDPLSVTAAGERSTNYESFLRSRIVSLGGEIAAIPSIAHATLVSWDLGGRKPFAPTGKGYRDSLIWATVLEYLRVLEGHTFVIFVSNNSRDFIIKDQIHADLRDDVRALNRGDALKYASGLTGVFAMAKNLRGGEQKPDELSNQEQGVEELNDSRGVRTDALDTPAATPGGPLASRRAKLKDLLLAGLEEQCIELVGSDLDEHTQDGDVFRPEWLSPELETPTIYGLEPVDGSLEWSVVETFTDGTLLINADAEAKLIVDGYMYKSDFYNKEDERKVTALAADHNDYYAWVAIEGWARITFSMLLSPDYEAVSHMELLSLETSERKF